MAIGDSNAQCGGDRIEVQDVIDVILFNSFYISISFIEMVVPQIDGIKSRSKRRSGAEW